MIGLVQSSLGFGYSMFLCASKKKKEVHFFIVFFFFILLLKCAVVRTVSDVPSCICYLNCQSSFNLSIKLPICSSGQMPKITWKT